MSTRSNIAIKLRESDRNKNLKTVWGGRINPKGAQYLYVYCHNNGYPEGVGADLNRMFNGESYKKALEYILKGDRSTTETSYLDWRGEKCGPYTSNELSDCYENDYLYWMEEVDGEIVVHQYGEDEEESVDVAELDENLFEWVGENACDESYNPLDAEEGEDVIDDAVTAFVNSYYNQVINDDNFEDWRDYIYDYLKSRLTEYWEEMKE